MSEFLPSSRTDQIDTLRPLGDVEKTLHQASKLVPLTFSFSLHLNTVVEIDALRDAVSRVQRVHPLLAARVTDGPRPHWVRTGAPVSVTHRSRERLTDVLAQEQVIPFSSGTDPLWRLILLDDPGVEIERTRVPCTLIASFSHQLVDGIGAVLVLGELLRALNHVDLIGRTVVPGAQEALLPVPNEIGADKAAALAALAASEPRWGVPSKLEVPVDDHAPEVTTVTLTAEQTSALITAAHAHETTVHAALSAAAHRVVRRRGHDFVRISHPADLRRIAHLAADDAALRLLVTSRTGSDATEAVDFWLLAKAIRADLSTQLDLDAVAWVSAQLSQMIPDTPEGALEAAAQLIASELTLTNVGVVNLPAGNVEAVGLTAHALWFRIAGYAIVAVATYAGRLTMTLTTDDSSMLILDDMIVELTAACAA